MPELPEVETFTRNLREGAAGCFALPGRIVRGYKLHWRKTLASPEPQQLDEWLPGQKVVAVKRRGKFLMLELTAYTMLFHLRMSGDLVTAVLGDDVAFKHIRFELIFTDGSRLIFNDPRKFGRVWVTPDPGEVLSRLGPEPLDASLTPAEFYSRLQGRKRVIKSLLLDQGFIAGLGNIYTDEALHLAGIHPQTSSHSIKARAAGCLLEAIQMVLKEGIARNGASIDWVYRGGEYQNNFRVYGRQGMPCPVCGTHIQRMLVGQRGTHICPQCQKK